jgi:hypothetical protein
MAFAGDQAFALVVRFRHRNDEDPVDVFDAHGPPVDMIGQAELTEERTCVPLSVMAHRMPSVARCRGVFSGNEEDTAMDLQADILPSDPRKVELNHQGRLNFRYRTPRVPSLRSELSLPGPGLVDEFTEEATHFLSHIDA